MTIFPDRSVPTTDIQHLPMKRPVDLYFEIVLNHRLVTISIAILVRAASTTEHQYLLMKRPALCNLSRCLFGKELTSGVAPDGTGILIQTFTHCLNQDSQDSRIFRILFVLLLLFS